MRRALRMGAAIVCGLVAGTVAAVTAAIVRWNVETARCVVRLRERADADAPPYSRDELAGLPDPVVRYFDFALTPGQPIVRNLRIRQTGEFAMRPEAWQPFTAVQVFSVPPGFLWDARVRLAPGMSFYVRDGYVAGEGVLYGAVSALIPVVNERGTPAMASGELLRYLVEAVFFPTALLPRDGVSWLPIDESTARVTLTDGATTVSSDVTFGERGEVTGISALRNHDIHHAATLTPWFGRFRDYRRVEGMMIPTYGEVEWRLPEGPFCYFRGRVVDARYDFAPDRPVAPASALQPAASR